MLVRAVLRCHVHRAPRNQTLFVVAVLPRKIYWRTNLTTHECYDGGPACNL